MFNQTNLWTCQRPKILFDLTKILSKSISLTHFFKFLFHVMLKECVQWIQGTSLSLWNVISLLYIVSRASALTFSVLNAKTCKVHNMQKSLKMPSRQQQSKYFCKFNEFCIFQQNNIFLANMTPHFKLVNTNPEISK